MLFSSCTKLEIINSYKQEPRNKNVSLKRIAKLIKRIHQINRQIMQR
jgi:hypothetical protein